MFREWLGILPAIQSLISALEQVRSPAVTKPNHPRVAPAARHRRAQALALFLVGVAAAKQAWSQAEGSPEWVVDRARQLEAHGHKEQSRELLRRGLEQQPASELLVVARADAYLRDNNPFWALKVLGSFVAEHPTACAARTMLARTHLLQANLDDAEQVLNESVCDQSEEMSARVLLIQAQIAELRGRRDEAKALVSRAAESQRRYEEDDQLLRHLQVDYDLHHLPVATVSLDAAAGATNSGIATVPADLATPDGLVTSGVLSLDARGHFTLSQRRVQTFADLELRLTQLTAGPNSSLSVRQPLARVGVVFGRGWPRLTVAYAYDLVHLQGGFAGVSGPRIDSEGHHMEYQLNVLPWLSAVGSIGGRLFDDSDRTRFESDLGLIANAQVADNARLSLGASGHAYRARRQTYDQAGAAGFAALTLGLFKGFDLRETVALGSDVFPSSRGFFHSGGTQNRSDRLIRATGELWSPPWLGVRLAMSYAYSQRDSNSAAYDYTDHRALIHVVWQANSDDLTVRRIGKQGRVAFEYEEEQRESTNGSPKREIRDVIKQDEDTRRGSSCLK